MSQDQAVSVEMPDPSADRRLLTGLLAVYLGLIPAGVILLRYLALESGLAMNLDRAVFWTLNALTGTGFALFPNGLEDFSPAGQGIVFGLMTAGAWLMLAAGGLLVARVTGMPCSRRKVVLGAGLMLGIGCAAGTGFLLTPTRDFWPAIFESMASLTNAGMSLDGPRVLHDIRLFTIILPLAAFGGLGLPVVLNLFESFANNKPLHDYTRRVLRLTALAWVVAFGVLLLCNVALPLRENVALSWLNAINSRTLGMDVESAFSLTRQAWWIVALLSLIGACPGGTAGGMKITTLQIVMRESGKLMRGEKSGWVLFWALRWMATFLGVTLLLFLLLLAQATQIPSERLAFIATSALGRSGLSHDTLSLTGMSLYLLSAGMLAGHLLPIWAGLKLWQFGLRTGRYDF